MSEDPWDDWETAADAGLSDCKKTTTEANQQLWQKANQYTAPVIIHTNTMAAHADYKPEIKILKRPQDAKTKQDAVLAKPVKTLAEKERDYEAAKRLIFEKFNK